MARERKRPKLSASHPRRRQPLRSVYRHETLPDPSTHIRLIELEDTGIWKDRGIRCKLAIFPLGKAPAYHAISYTWGDPSPSERINLVGKVMLIPKNTANVLHLLRYHNKSWHYWIDSICIDQSNIKEKNGQVALMSMIYEQATHVLVCLDHVDDRVENAMHIISEIQAKAPDMTKLREVLLWKPSLGSANAEDQQWERQQHLKDVHDDLVREIKALSTLLGHRFPDFLTGLLELSKRSYFQRMWVVQELVLASSASLCCGKAYLPVSVVRDCLRMADWIFDIHYDDFMGQNKLMPASKKLKPFVSELIPEPYAMLRGPDLAAMKLLQYHFGADASTKMSFSPDEAIVFADIRKCTDKRDCIYSILGLIRWDQPTPIQPDYNKTPFELALEFLQCMVIDTTDKVGRLLIGNLALTVNDPGVKGAITARQAESSVRAMAPEHSTAISQSTTRVIKRFRGVKITRTSCVNIVPHIHHLFYGYGGCETRIFAADLQPEDWLVFAQDEHCGFILRQAGGILDIVGYAYSDTSYTEAIAGPHDDFRSFEIVFDPEDFIVCTTILNDTRGAGGANLRTRSFPYLARTPICKEHSSSFARFANDLGDDEPWRSRYWKPKLYKSVYDEE